jgi:PAS domain S-box-containing protein
MSARSGSELLRGVFDAVPDAVVVVDGGGRIVIANARCRAVFDRDPEELPGRTIDLLVPEGFAAGDVGEARDGHLRLTGVRRDGTEFPAEISLAPVAAGGRRYVAATVRDTTARNRDQERFRSLLDAAPDPTVIVDSAGEIVLVNNRTLEVFGHRRSDLVGKPIEVLAVPGREQEMADGFAAYLTAPNKVPMSVSDRPLEVRHGDGRRIPVEVSLSPLTTEEGVLVSVALRDVTERLRLQAASQRLRDELIATVSHELRTPLTAIIGYAELMADLDEADLSRRARKLLAVIERNAGRELQLVNDLLTMAFLEDDRIAITRQPVELAEVARRVVEDHGLRARERGVQLRRGEGDAAPVTGDFYRLVQALENLVTNALKFTRPGGTVVVSVVEQGATAALEVRDTGVGLSPEERSKVFDRLYRAPGAIASQTQGVGLGLPIVRAIAEAHGGSVELESEVDAGTVVRLAVPHVEVPARHRAD